MQQKISAFRWILEGYVFDGELFVQLRKCHRYWWWSKGNHFSSGTLEKDKKIEAVQFANVSFGIFGETIDEFLWENRKVKVSRPKVNGISVKELRTFQLHFFPNILKASWNDFLTHTLREGKKKVHICILRIKDDKWHILLEYVSWWFCLGNKNTRVNHIIWALYSNSRSMIKTGCGSEGRGCCVISKNRSGFNTALRDIHRNQDKLLNVLELPRLLYRMEWGPWRKKKKGTPV